MNDLPNAKTEKTRPEPADADQIANSPKQPIADAILGVPVAAGPVMHRHLDHPRAAYLADTREEPVRADEERYALDRSPAIRLERAARVGDVIADDRAPDAVRDAR